MEPAQGDVGELLQILQLQSPKDVHTACIAFGKNPGLCASYTEDLLQLCVAL